jgi:Flp pilus assembly protein TadG
MNTVAKGNARHRSVHGESGSTIIETALALTILFPLIFGMMEACLGVYTYHFISEASREATRYAIVRGATYTTNCATPPNYATCVAQGADITTYVQNLNFPGIDPTKMTVTSTWLKSDGTTACGTTNSCKVPGNQVNVVITYSFPLSIPWVPVNTWNLASTSQMVISQ